MGSQPHLVNCWVLVSVLPQGSAAFGVGAMLELK